MADLLSQLDNISPIDLPRQETSSFSHLSEEPTSWFAQYLLTVHYVSNTVPSIEITTVIKKDPIKSYNYKTLIVS